MSTVTLASGKHADRRQLFLLAMELDPRYARAHHSLGVTLSPGETVVLPRTNVTAEEDTMQLGVLDRGSVSLRELVDGLNAMGVSPRDMITILQAIKAAGALQADIEVL